MMMKIAVTVGINLRRDEQRHDPFPQMQTFVMCPSEPNANILIKATGYSRGTSYVTEIVQLENEIAVLKMRLQSYNKYIQKALLPETLILINYTSNLTIALRYMPTIQ